MPGPQFRDSREGSDPDERATVFFDGGCAPNPGPIEIAVVYRGAAYFRDGGKGDNSEAEWRALLFAVEIALLHSLTNVTFVGDSALVVAQATGTQPCRSDRLQSYMEAFRVSAASIPRVNLRCVRRGKNLAGIALARRRLP